VAYLIKLRVIGSLAQLSEAPTSCTQHCRMRILGDNSREKRDSERK
jgi:hypothetical protein